MDISTINSASVNLENYFITIQDMDFSNKALTRYIEASKSVISCLTQVCDDVMIACPKRMISNLDLILDGKKDKDFFNRCIYPELEHLIYICRNSHLVSRHGGARPNAGRKKEEPTKQIRIPESLYTLINDLKVAYKDLIEEDKQILRSSLRDIITTAEFEGIETNQVYNERCTKI
ncbi:hypothetical protein [Aliivibrio sifiae]|uniref:hypothetical protein n=1 Tax=Aliivibrio sifiae TaxID=566293 RepID=UPI003D0B4AB5